MKIDEFVEKFANQFADPDIELVKGDTQFRNLETWDSLTGMAVLTMIQDNFGIVIPIEDFLKLTTAKELFEYIQSKMQS